MKDAGVRATPTSTTFSTEGLLLCSVSKANRPFSLGRLSGACLLEFLLNDVSKRHSMSRKRNALLAVGGQCMQPAS